RRIAHASAVGRKGRVAADADVTSSSSSVSWLCNGFGGNFRPANDFLLGELLLCRHRNLLPPWDARGASSLQLSRTEARENGEFEAIDSVWTFDHRDPSADWFGVLVTYQQRSGDATHDSNDAERQTCGMRPSQAEAL